MAKILARKAEMRLTLSHSKRLSGAERIKKSAGSPMKNKLGKGDETRQFGCEMRANDKKPGLYSISEDGGWIAQVFNVLGRGRAPAEKGGVPGMRGIVIAFKNCNGHEREVFLPNALLNGDVGKLTTVLSELGFGLDHGDGARKALKRYVAGYVHSKRIIVAPRTGWLWISVAGLPSCSPPRSSTHLVSAIRSSSTPTTNRRRRSSATRSRSGGRTPRVWRGNRPELVADAWALIQRVALANGRVVEFNQRLFEEALTRTADRRACDDASGDVMREPEMQLEHRVIIASSVVAASGSILNGVDEFSKIRRDLAIRITNQRLGAGHERRERGAECLEVAVGATEGEARNAEWIVFLVETSQWTQDAGDVGWYVQIEDQAVLLQRCLECSRQRTPLLRGQRLRQDPIAVEARVRRRGTVERRA